MALAQECALVWMLNVEPAQRELGCGALSVFAVPVLTDINL